MNHANTRVVQVLLSPCETADLCLTQVPLLPPGVIKHPSPYAQEQASLEVGRALRKHLVTLLMVGRLEGSMNLLQWLLWQLYGEGRYTCPCFATGHYALRYVHPSGGSGMTLALFDLQLGQVVGEYLISPLLCPELFSLLQVIAGKESAPEAIFGIASRDDSVGAVFDSHP